MKINVPSKRFCEKLKAIPYALVMLLFSPTLFGQAQLIKDVNTAENQYIQEYSEVTSDGNGNVYFISRGKELWIHRGSVLPATTVMIKSMRTISNLTVVGSNVFFVGEDGAGKELWKTNGTGATTRRVKEIRSGSQGSNPMYLTNINGTLYFAANDGTHGNELWKTNGTEAGTVLVKDFNPGSADGNPQWMTDVNGTIFLAATGASKGSELWKTDGTSAGSAMVLDIYIGTTGSSPAYLANVNGKLFFTATSQLDGRELWISDGTIGGTDIIHDLNPGPGSSVITNITALNNTAYFAADDGNGVQLWKSNGFHSTAKLTSFYELCESNEESEEYDPDCEKLQLVFFKVIGNNLFFVQSNSGNASIHRVDGTSGTVSKVKTLPYDGVNPSYTLKGDLIYFFQMNYADLDPDVPFNEETLVLQLYSMNQSGGDIQLVRNFYHAYTFEGGMLPQTSMTLANNQLYFPGILNANEGYKMLRSGGTYESTYIVKDTYAPTSSANVRNLLTHNGISYFSTGGYDFGTKVWRTDGTASGTFMLKQFHSLIEMTISGNAVYVLGQQGAADELWKTDGTLAGTTLMKSFTSDEFGFAQSPMLDVYGTLYLRSAKGTLWKSNGTPASTVALKDFQEIHYLGKGGGRAIFSVFNEGRHELWRSSGTTNSTAKLKTINPTPYFVSERAARTTANDIFYFVALTDGIGYELWRSNGTTSGTFMLKDLRQNDALEYEDYSMTTFRDTLYFATKTPDNRFGLYKTDGTTTGTKQVATIPNQPDLVSTDKYILLFMDGIDGATLLWRSEGYLAQFVMVFDGGHPYNRDYEVLDDVVYFASEYTSFLWRTDGTECGTFTLDTPQDPYPLTINGDNLIFGATTEAYGHEPYRLSLQVVPSSPCAAETMLAPLAAEAKSVEYGPNPFTEQVNLNISGAARNVSVIIKNFTGEIVYQSTNENKQVTLGENWPTGLYIVDVLIDGKSETFRLVKK